LSFTPTANQSSIERLNEEMEKIKTFVKLYSQSEFNQNAHKFWCFHYCDFGEPAENYFETHVGSFWGFIETQNYCRFLCVFEKK
jgi:hypothetical protein